MQYQQMTLNVEGLSTFILASNDEDAKSSQRNATLSDKIHESQRAIILASEMSKRFYHKPLVVNYSGGKDSDVLLHLVENCLKSDEFEVLNSHTSVDAPETVYHIRNVFKRLSDKGIKTTVHQPKDHDGNPITMWNLIPKMEMPPTRFHRYCCKILKEASTPNSISLTGVRESESTKRKGRDIFNIPKRKIQFSLDHAQEVFQESIEINDDTWDCTLIKQMKDNGNVVVTPVYYWSDDDVWQYIKDNSIEVNPLYAKGYRRVGCIGCPLGTHKQMLKNFEDYPKYRAAYISAFERMLKAREAKGKITKGEGYHNWSDGEAVFEWWLEEYKRNIKGQMTIEDIN